MTTGIRKWIVLAAGVLALLLAYVVAGPWIAIHGIHRAIEQRELGRLERYVDFPVLRGRLRGQMEDRLARATGELGGSTLGDIARGLLNRVGGSAVDGLVTPDGIAILLEGRSLARRVSGAGPDADAEGRPAGYRPLRDARTRFESPSRFTATTADRDGQPMVFVFERQGLRWRLVDIRLPPA